MKNKQEENEENLESVPKDPEDEDLNYRTEDSYSFEGSELPLDTPMKICPECNATDEFCSVCDGEGQIADESFIEDVEDFFENDED